MNNKEKNFVSAVVYVHNAACNIESFLTMLVDCLETNFEHSEIICVNDSSMDDSATCIKRVSNVAKSTSISIVHMSHFHGVELAMNAGVSLSIGDFVFEFDSTIVDYDKQVIMDVYYKSMDGYDIVSAVSSTKEKLSSKLFYRVFDRYTDLSYKMHTEKFRILSRRVINRIESMNKTTPYRKAIYASQGLNTDIVNYVATKSDNRIVDRQERNYRTSLAVDSLILFTEVGYRFSMMMTAFMMIMSIFMVLYSVIIYATAVPVAGWTTTILFLSVAFFGLFAILTIIIKYLQLIVDLVFKRKQFTFTSIEKLTK